MAVYSFARALSGFLDVVKMKKKSMHTRGLRDAESFLKFRMLH